MTPSPELHQKLRKLLNEMLPSPPGTDADTNFTNAEIDDLLRAAPNIYAAASVGWAEKAALLVGDIESYGVGSEKYTLSSLRDRLAHAQAMSKQYQEMSADKSGGSFMIRARPPC